MAYYVPVAKFKRKDPTAISDDFEIPDGKSVKSKKGKSDANATREEDF